MNLHLTDKVALITGVTGQDGAYLAEFLLEKGYLVHGIKRRTSLFNTDRIDHLYQDLHEKNLRFQLHHGDLTDSSSLIRIIQQVQPDEIYNLAAQSHVAVSLDSSALHFLPPTSWKARCARPGHSYCSTAPSASRTSVAMKC